MALFNKYSLKKEPLMEDWELVDNVQPILEKLSSSKDGVKKEDMHALLKNILVKKNIFGKERQLTDEEINKITFVDANKYAADFFFLYMKRKTDIAKAWQNSAKKQLTSLKN